MRAILVALSKRASVRLFRNQTGKYKLDDGRFLSSGLCVGSADLIGWSTVEITPEMVGRKLAVFTAIETKSERGYATSEQLNFIKRVKEAGGIAGVARNSDEAFSLIDSRQ